MKIHKMSNYFVSDSSKKDTFSNALLQFKSGRSVYVREIVKCAKLFAKENMNNYNYIIRALDSKEIRSLGNKPLDYLCYQMAGVFYAKYLKNYFAKSQEMSSLKDLDNKGGHVEHLINNCYIQDNYDVDLNGKKILLIDDIYTTGSAVENMARTIKNSFPDCIIEAFVLGVSAQGALQSGDINNLFQINIEVDYYDNSEYSDVWVKEGYLKIGFLKSRHEIFPQEWYCDVIPHTKNRETQYYVRIMLEESKEMFLTTLGRLKALFGETDFFVQVGDSIAINNDKYYIGVRNRDPYLIQKDYKELFSELIE